MTLDRTRTPSRPADASGGPIPPLRAADNAPEGEPGNGSARPEAEQMPSRREGTVSDPDQYGRKPAPTVPAEAPYAGVGTVSNTDCEADRPLATPTEPTP